MINLVVDASVVIKWFIPEIYSSSSRELLNNKTTFLAPELIYYEVTNVLWSKQKQKEISSFEAKEILSLFLRLPFKTTSGKLLAEMALEIAENLLCSIYDATYLALAWKEKSKFITADKKFYMKVRGSKLSNLIKWVEEK